MKLIRVINSEQFKTWSKEVERVTFKGKTYISSRYVNYPKTNTLTLQKQRIVKDLLNRKIDIEEISDAVGVPASTIAMWISHNRSCLVGGDQDE